MQGLTRGVGWAGMRGGCDRIRFLASFAIFAMGVGGMRMVRMCGVVNGLRV
jgi:hypothetical protein